MVMCMKVTGLCNVVNRTYKELLILSTRIGHISYKQIEDKKQVDSSPSKNKALISKTTKACCKVSVKHLEDLAFLID